MVLTDRSETITMVEILYLWLPSTCSGCGQIGHKASRCLFLNAATSGQITSSAKGVNEVSKTLFQTEI